MTTQETPELGVVELGEDGDDWIVLTARNDIAEEAVRRRWAENLSAFDIEDQYGEVTSDDFTFTYRHNWAWKPLDPEYPDEAYLVHGAAGDGLERFAGTRVTL